MPRLDRPDHLAAIAMMGIALNASAAVVTIDSSASFEPTSAFDVATFDASGSDKLVVVVTGEHNFPNNPTGQIFDITYDGVSLTNAVDRDPIDSANITAADIWYLDDPGSVYVAGALDATVSGSGNNYVYTVLALSNTLPGVGATAISVPNSKSVDLNALGAGSLVLASHGMGGDGNTANVLFVDPDAPATELSALKAGQNYAGHVTSHTNGVGAGNATYSFTGGSATGVVTIAAEFLAVLEPGIQFCAGDGMGSPCPCVNDNNGSMGGCDWGNPAFPGGGVLDAIGSASMAANDTLLTATGVENNFGIFFGANNAVNGGNGNPLNDGLRCAGGGLVRLIPPTMASGNQLTLPAPVQTLDTGAAAGVTRHYQYWFRTPNGPCGLMANLTNGYEISWAN